MMKLQIIVASTRPTRSADRVVPWVVERAKGHAAFEVELLDLREWPLPFFSEHFGTIGDPSDPTYSTPIVKQWNQKIKEADAFLFVTAEYNHGMPGVLKNAIDTVWFSYGFRNKAAGFVAYSVGLTGGARAVEQLVQVLVETETMPVRSTVLVPFVLNAFNQDGTPINPLAETAMSIMLDDLAWLAKAMKQARAQGELIPAIVRTRAAIAAAAKT